MKTVILTNYVRNDGKGDFQHFVDIYLALKNNENIKNYEFIPIVVCGDPQLLETIASKFKKLGITNGFIYSEGQTPPHQKQEVQALLAKAEQLFNVSHFEFPDFEKYEKHLNPKALKKYISEHEAIIPAQLRGDMIRYTLGFSEKGTYGIKLNDISRLPPIEAMEIFEKNDKPFAEALLKYSNTPDAKNFAEQNTLIPVYFNKWDNLGRFMRIILNNESLVDDKNISLYLSGDLVSNSGSLSAHNMRLKPNFTSGKMDLFDADGEKIENKAGERISPSTYKLMQVDGKFTSLFSCFFNYLFFNIFHQRESLASNYINSSIKQIQIIEPGTNKAVDFPINPNGTRSVQIYYGFQVSEKSYHAIYQQAPYAGVSGDNSFEKAISSRAFPMYHSTNHTIGRSCSSFKNESFAALSNIVKKIDLPSEVKAGYVDYFSNLGKFFTANHNEWEKADDKFKKMNLKEMIRHWPTVADYLIKNHNFYDKLESVFFDKLQANLESSQQFTDKLQLHGMFSDKTPIAPVVFDSNPESPKHNKS